MKKTTTTQKPARQAYIGTFVKVDGSVRTMKFMATEKQIAAAKPMLVWDVEKNGLRSFNFKTLIGRVLPA